MVNYQFLIRVATHYVAEQSDPSLQRYVFSYTITIENNSQDEVQLLRRRWLITDANGKELHVEGEGVIGEQPIIASGKQYTYTSGTLIETPIGVMEGAYTFIDTSNNDEFEIEIKPFRLCQPNLLH